MTTDQPKPLTLAEETERSRLMRIAGAGRLSPADFSRVAELNQRRAIAEQAADARVP